MDLQLTQQEGNPTWSCKPSLLWLVPSEIMDLRGASTTAAFPNQHNFNCILNTYPYVHRKAYQRSFILEQMELITEIHD